VFLDESAIEFAHERIGRAIEVSYEVKLGGSALMGVMGFMIAALSYTHMLFPSGWHVFIKLRKAKLSC